MGIREAAASIRCPVCTAEPGEDCHYEWVPNSRLKPFHRERYEAARSIAGPTLEDRVNNLEHQATDLRVAVARLNQGAYRGAQIGTPIQEAFNTLVSDLNNILGNNWAEKPSEEIKQRINQAIGRASSIAI